MPGHLKACDHDKNENWTHDLTWMWKFLVLGCTEVLWRRLTEPCKLNFTARNLKPKDPSPVLYLPFIPPSRAQMMSSKTLYIISVWHPHHPFKANVSVVNENPLHHQDVTTWHSNNIMACLGWKVYACTQLTNWKKLLWAGMWKQRLWSPPFDEGRNGGLRCTMWHSYLYTYMIHTDINCMYQNSDISEFLCIKFLILKLSEF